MKPSGFRLLLPITLLAMQAVVGQVLRGAGTDEGSRALVQVDSALLAESKTEEFKSLEGLLETYDAAEYVLGVGDCQTIGPSNLNGTLGEINAAIVSFTPGKRITCTASTDGGIMTMIFGFIVVNVTSGATQTFFANDNQDTGKGFVGIAAFFPGEDVVNGKMECCIGEPGCPNALGNLLRNSVSSVVSFVGNLFV